MKFFGSRFDYRVPDGAKSVSRRPWQPGVWRRAPISGLLALICAFLCGIATIAILESSDQLPLNQWRLAGYVVQPTVLLSLFATLANALFRYAFTEGARVSWWVQAQKGASVGRLHRTWDHAQSALPVVTAGRQTTFTAVASFLVFVLLIDGPLFQRATSVQVITRTNTTNLTVPVSPSPFLQGATGIFPDHDPIPHLFTPQFTGLLQEYNKAKPITLPDFGCRGKCEFDLIAPGWDVECDSWESPYRLMTPDEYSRFDDHPNQWKGPSNRQMMFWSNVTYGTDASEMWHRLHNYRTGSNSSLTKPIFESNWILLSSMRKSTKGSKGILKWRYCVLREAVQRYPVIVTNTTVTIKDRDAQRNLTMYRVGRDIEMESMGDMPSTIGGFWLALSHQFAGKADITSVGGWSAVNAKDSSPLVYLKAPNATSLTTLDVMWNDPIDDMISMIQDLSLRTAIATTFHAPEPPGISWQPLPPAEFKASQKATLTAAQPDVFSPNLTNVNRTLSQNVFTTIVYDETVYQSNRPWMAGALIVIGVAFCAVLPIFGDWWHLGRYTSLSPIEVAKAFDAPLLRQADPNGTAEDIVNDVGRLKIQYGASEAFDKDGLLNGNEASSRLSGQDNNGDDYPWRMLHFSTKNSVAAPQEGETFGLVQQVEAVDESHPSYSNAMYGHAV